MKNIFEDDRTNINLFAYGTLMSPEVWSSVVVGNYQSRQSVLHGYARYALKGRLYPAMIRQKGRMVKGLVFQDISPDDILLLDDFEGEAYYREHVEVMTNERKIIKCQTYIATSVLDEILLSDPWDHEVFRKNHLADFMSNYPGWKTLNI